MKVITPLELKEISASEFKFIEGELLIAIMIEQGALPRIITISQRRDEILLKRQPGILVVVECVEHRSLNCMSRAIYTNNHLRPVNKTVEVCIRLAKP